MFETLIGESQYGLKFGLALVVVLALIALSTWLVRRFGAKRAGPQPRAAVSAASGTRTNGYIAGPGAAR